LCTFAVALRKESVDRNMLSLSSRPVVGSSLSARRAWIEMPQLELIPLTDPVALRKESVDRNSIRSASLTACIMSLSARRAWIEMDWASVITAMTSRRSPQGERG